MYTLRSIIRRLYYPSSSDFLSVFSNKSKKRRNNLRGVKRRLVTLMENGRTGRRPLPEDCLTRYLINYLTPAMQPTMFIGFLVITLDDNNRGCYGMRVIKNR